MTIELKDLVLIELDLSNKEILDEINFAIKTAKQKSIKNNTQNTWQKNRSSLKKFTDLFPGDLAKNLVRKQILEKFNIELIDYDKIRTDDFQNNDLFDLKYKSKEIEVKSSIEKYTNKLENLIKNRRIIVYSTRKITDIVFQVFYIFENFDGKKFFVDMEILNENEFKNTYNINSIKDFVKLFLKYSPKAYIMGFMNKKQIKEIISEGKNITLQNSQIIGEKKRDYGDLFISRAKPFEDIFNELK